MFLYDGFRHNLKTSFFIHTTVWEQQRLRLIKKKREHFRCFHLVLSKQFETRLKLELRFLRYLIKVDLIPIEHGVVDLQYSEFNQWVGFSHVTRTIILCPSGLPVSTVSWSSSGLRHRSSSFFLCIFIFSRSILDSLWICTLNFCSFYIYTYETCTQTL